MTALCGWLGVLTVKCGMCQPPSDWQRNLPPLAHMGIAVGAAAPCPAGYIFGALLYSPDVYETLNDHFTNFNWSQLR